MIDNNVYNNYDATLHKWINLSLITLTTHTTLFTCTGAPQVVVATPVNSTTVNVSWSEVQCFNESGAVTHYLVQYWSICGGAVQNVTTSGTIQTFSGLTPNYVYTFRVAAVGASQKIGPFSNPANTVPPGELYRTVLTVQI